MLLWWFVSRFPLRRHRIVTGSHSARFTECVGMPNPSGNLRQGKGGRQGLRTSKSPSKPACLPTSRPSIRNSVTCGSTPPTGAGRMCRSLWPWVCPGRRTAARPGTGSGTRSRRARSRCFSSKPSTGLVAPCRAWSRFCPGWSSGMWCWCRFARTSSCRPARAEGLLVETFQSQRVEQPQQAEQLVPPVMVLHQELVDVRDAPDQVVVDGGGVGHEVADQPRQ